MSSKPQCLIGISHSGDFLVLPVHSKVRPQSFVSTGLWWPLLCHGLVLLCSLSDTLPWTRGHGSPGRMAEAGKARASSGLKF